MEGYSIEDSKSLTDESWNDENNTGMGRSYECVFCKRGFTTAQALGGHMNIHRKDRSPSANSKMNPRRMSNNNSVLVPSVTSNNQHKVHSFFPAPTWLIATSSSSSLPHHHHWDLSLELGLSSEDDGKDKRQNATGCEEADLDLELRLGHA